MREFSMILEVLLPLAWVAGGYAVGAIVEKFVLAGLRRAARRTEWEWDDVAINSLRRMPTLWFLIAGVDMALRRIPVSSVVLNNSEKVFVVVIILSITVVLSRIASGAVGVFSKRAKGAFPATSIFAHFSTVLIFVLGVLVILQWLRIPITPIVGALGLGGLAVALALQDTLSNLFAGLQIIASRKVRPGDYIKLESGEEGYVVDITWRNTTVRAIHNNMIIVPNAKLASAVTVNFNLPQREMAVRVEVGVSYDSDLREVERVTIEVAKEVLSEIQGGAPEFEPFIRYHTFADFSINFTVVMYVKDFFSQYVIKHEFVKKLHARFNEKGIEIPFPIRTVYMKQNGDEESQAPSP